MKKHSGLFKDMPYDRLILLAACLLLTLYGLWCLKNPLLRIFRGVADWHAYVWLLVFAVEAAIFGYGVYVAWKKWEDPGALTRFVFAALAYLVISTLLDLFYLWSSPGWTHWPSTPVSKTHYALSRVANIISLTLLYSIPIVALQPKLSAIKFMDFARQGTAGVQDRILEQTASLQEMASRYATKAGMGSSASTAGSGSGGLPSIGNHAVPDELYAAFIGGSAPYYMPRFAKFAFLGGNFAVSWNWAGFFFPQVWLFYRKMYLFGIIALLVSSFFNILGWFLSGIIVGLCGNYAYYTHATKKLTGLQASPVPEENRLPVAAMIGGTNMLLALLILFANLIVFFFIFSASSLMLGFLFF